MNGWMTQLAQHLRLLRVKADGRRLAVLFDIDGTILDSRYMILYALRAFDRSQGTHFFHGLSLADIDMPDTRLGELFARQGVKYEYRRQIVDWYLNYCWRSNHMLEAQIPYAGVFAVIRWLQLQPGICVGLNTGRGDKLREVTLRTLNRLGERHRVRFTDDLLYTRPENLSIQQGKVEGICYFEQLGLQVAAMIDNEPANLLAIADAFSRQHLMLLHADTIFDSPAWRSPPNLVSGTRYNVEELVDPHTISRHVHIVWRSEPGNSWSRFLASTINWGEIDVHEDPLTGEPIMGARESLPLPAGAAEPRLADYLAEALVAGKSLRINIDGSGHLLCRVARMLAQTGAKATRFCLRGPLNKFTADAVRQAAELAPKTELQVSADFAAPVTGALPESVITLLDTLCSWGITSYSVDWRTPNKTRLLTFLLERGYSVDIRGLSRLDDFLQAVLMSPRSVTCDPDLLLERSPVAAASE